MAGNSLPGLTPRNRMFVTYVVQVVSLQPAGNSNRPAIRYNALSLPL